MRRSASTAPECGTSLNALSLISKAGVPLPFVPRLSNVPTWRRRGVAMTPIWKCLPFALVWSVVHADATLPGILITNLPAYNTLQNVSGLVYGTNPGSLAVAVFIYVPGYGWGTKPTCAQPLTTVRPDGSWTADITTGGTDTLATRVAALLVQ